MSDSQNLDALATQLSKFGIVTGIFDGKITLVCEKHKFYYNPRALATLGCKACHMIQHTGLLMAIPKERQDEILEDLEYSVHHFVEADKRGEINLKELEKAIHVKIENEHGRTRILK